MRGEYAKFLAPYQSQIKQLTDKSSDLKGQPLKTSLRIMMGGQQCSAIAKTKANAAASGDNSAGGSGNPLTNVAQAGKAIGSSVGNLVGGLFHKKKTDDSQTPASAAAPPDTATASSPPAAPVTAPANSDPYAQFLQLAAYTSETITINTAAISPDRFDVPADWKKDIPKPAKKADAEFTCPNPGT
jgi:hypothetical protein